MKEVNVTELRNKLPAYIGQVKADEELLLTSRGKAIAQLIPVEDARKNARLHLSALRKKCQVGDVVTPLDEIWDLHK
jgi:prevent-host-death family protein